MFYYNYGLRIRNSSHLNDEIEQSINSEIEQLSVNSKLEVSVNSEFEQSVNSELLIASTVVKIASTKLMSI